MAERLGGIARFSTAFTTRAQAGIVGKWLLHRGPSHERSLSSFVLERGFLLERFVEVRQGVVREVPLPQHVGVNSGGLQWILVHPTSPHALHDVAQVYVFLRLSRGLDLIQKDTEASIVHAERSVYFYLERTYSSARLGAEISPKAVA